MLPRLHLVTDDVVLRDASFATRAEAVLGACGVDVALQLRGHHTSGRVLYLLAERLAAAALRSGAWLFVNDRVDVAMAVRAHGAQLGVRSLPMAAARALLGQGATIGYSAHGALDAARAAAEGADFVVVGTIFESASHPLRPPGGVSLAQECVSAARVPVIAIGGVTIERVAELAAAQVYGVAVSSGVWRADDEVAAAAGYAQALRRQLGGAQQRSEA